MTRIVGIDSDKCDDSSMRVNDDESNIKTLVEQLLTRRVFHGVYLERRWVELVNDYRDVIVINKNENEKLEQDLMYAMKRLREFYGDSKWIGITGPNCIGAPAGYCLWVKMHNMPLGQHKFCIKKVKFTDNEIFSTIKSVEFIDSTTEPQTINQSQNKTVNTYETEEIVLILKEKFVQMLKDCHSLLTMKNFKTFIAILVMVMAVIFKFLLSSIKGLGDFTLRLINELTKFTHASMPLLLSVMDLINKIIGGIFILFAMVFREIFRPRNQGQLQMNGNVDRNRYLTGPPHQPMGYNRYGPNFGPRPHMMDQKMNYRYNY